MRMRQLLAVSAAACVVAVAVPSSAQAGTKTVNGCPPGHVCVYDANPSGPTYAKPVFSTEGGFSHRSIPVKRIFNNGKKHPGADHIYYHGKAGWGEFRGCLHFHESANTAMDKGTFADLSGYTLNPVIQSAYWGDECPANRPVLQLDIHGDGKGWITPGS
ncbi:hypothetical protein [Streptomyces alkaliterrae]|uniref:Peptidase inhibitor family I36 protein n=1 Tax=Streptomyces alkaliterrae TaxID=2213162 RepID=A0A5P0YJB6_9ACTN|nr:hypothetical protein [Streptomyces alkaliterrae]MBB1252417.1 hypothetical protein [Streptomyces alkaliterrae]MBB1258530.1 hypothetical protein [Streptomyces alkaliterrae]MQS00473.1 hypothetical protein [Streptomyces alkaliterrae]